MPNKNYKARFKFCDLEDEYFSWDKSRIAILPVAYDLTTSYKSGASAGPKAIIDASKHMETYDDETGKEIYKFGIYTAKEIKQIGAKPEDIINKIEKEVISILKAGKFPVVLGGEHSITLGPVRACKKIFKNFSVLQLDAHRDMRDSFQGSKYSHACIAKRIVELTGLSQAGVRSMSKEESGKSNNNLKTFFMKDMIKNEDWIEDVIYSLDSNRVYVTIDMDALDPSIMPSVGTPEPGGMGWYETLTLLKKLSQEKEIIGFDIVELCPIPGNISPDFLTAKLIYKFLNYIF
ncbi:MAG TPA: agmatinase [Candidatus Omnitrophica bacterium]|nr:agmatinase [Candidatus Omnitrophota bacterium]